MRDREPMLQVAEAVGLFESGGDTHRGIWQKVVFVDQLIERRPRRVQVSIL